MNAAPKAVKDRAPSPYPHQQLKDIRSRETSVEPEDESDDLLADAGTAAKRKVDETEQPKGTLPGNILPAPKSALVERTITRQDMRAGEAVETSGKSAGEAQIPSDSASKTSLGRDESTLVQDVQPEVVSIADTAANATENREARCKGIDTEPTSANEEPPCKKICLGLSTPPNQLKPQRQDNLDGTEMEKAIRMRAQVLKADRGSVKKPVSRVNARKGRIVKIITPNKTRKARSFKTFLTGCFVGAATLGAAAAALLATVPESVVQEAAREFTSG